MSCHAARAAQPEAAVAPDTWSVPVDGAALCLNDFVVFAKRVGVCPRCGSFAWIALSFYVSRRGLSIPAAPPP